MRRERSHLLGTSGTVTTVAGIHLGLAALRPLRRVDGCWMRTSDARAVTQSLIDRSYDERVAEPCIGRERADLVLAGLRHPGGDRGDMAVRDAARCRPRPA